MTCRPILAPARARRDAALLVEADATDPAATGNALARLAAARRQRAARDWPGRWRRRPGAARSMRVQRRYNPEGITAYNIVPGPAGRHPDHDDGDDDLPGDDARARARHDGEPAGHAGAADRSDDRQDRALHRDRLGPGGVILCAGAVDVRRADARQAALLLLA